MNDAGTFKMIPLREQLEALPRKFAFQPSSVEWPQALARDEVDRYNRDGFLLGVPIFDSSEAADIRRYFDRLLEETLAAGGDSYSISTAHLKHRRVYDLLAHPRIVGCVQDLLGEDVIGWGSHFFCKMPRDGKAVAWHQDASYWPMSRSNTVTVWLAVDDADRENACMQFIRGSHRHGLIPYRASTDAEGNVLDQTVEDAEEYGEIVDVELEAGQVSLHSDLLLHGSEPNHSDRRRCGLTLRYCTPDVKAGLDWHKKGVVVSGTDPYGNWANPPRPK
jgi:non-haem Fe2+, alpha-ketoglutarate-dependent halogenase